MSIIEKESKKEIPLPQKANSQSVLKDLFKNPIEKEMNKLKPIKCIESISFSSFNPVPPYRRLQGDLFYLSVKSLDHGDFGITCCVNGFYRNDSIEK
jgi:protein TIF31